MDNVPLSPLVSALLTRIDAYCARRGLSRARVSTLAVNKGDFCAGLLAGKTCTIETLDRFHAWLEGAEAALPDELPPEAGGSESVAAP